MEFHSYSEYAFPIHILQLRRLWQLVQIKHFTFDQMADPRLGAHSLQFLAFQLGHIMSSQRRILELNAWGRIWICHIMIPFYSLISEAGITQHQYSYHDSKVVGCFLCSKYNWIHKKTDRADFAVFPTTFLRTHHFFLTRCRYSVCLQMHTTDVHWYAAWMFLWSFAKCYRTESKRKSEWREALRRSVS